MAKSSKPSGVTIKRSGNSFITSWKIPSGGYGDGQNMQWSASNNKSWHGVSIGKTAKSKSLTWTGTNYYPYKSTKLTWIKTRVRGNRSSYKSGGTKWRPVYTNPGVSDWVTVTYTIKVPSNPSASVNLNESENTPYVWPKFQFKFSTPNTSGSAATWYTRATMTTVLVKDSTITDGSKIDWNTNFPEANTRIIRNYSSGYKNDQVITGTRFQDTTSGASGTFTIIDDTSLISDGSSYTRWFRVIAQGPAGSSSYAYAKRVYASPNKCDITAWKVTAPSSNIGYTAQIWFNAPSSADRPLDKVVTQYAMSTPESGLTCPDNVSWKDGTTFLVSDSTAGATFNIESGLSADQCLFARVNSIYGDRTTYGAPKAIDYGKLTKPTGLNVEVDPTTYRATVTATNNSNVPDSFLVVRYMTEEDPDGFDLAIIPHDETTAIGIQCPEWTSNPRFGVYAVAPGNCYVINSGYYIQSDSIYETGEYDVSREGFYDGVGRIPGTYRFEYDRDAEFRLDVQSQYEEGVLTVNDQAFYNAVSGSYGSYDFAYDSSVGYKTEVESDILQTSITIDDGTFYEAVSEEFGTYSFIYDEGIWHLNESEIDILDYGIELSIVPSDGDMITVNLIETGAWSVEGTEISLSDYGITLTTIPEDADSFTIDLIEVGRWILNSNKVYLDDYGITITEDPTDGDWIEVSLNELEDRVTRYEVSPKMTSDIQTAGGSIPVAPESVTLSQGAISGTVRVMWDWAWDEADSAELSWADHDDAWESTEEPNTYTITKMRASAWNISGLDPGLTWYVRVRLIKTRGDNQTFGAYSKIAEIDLASAPMIPILTLSESIITASGQFTASWSYSSTDGTSQSFAEVAEVVEENGQYEYRPLIQTQTAESVVISAEEQGWVSGETHTLAVRVISASGRESDGWSNEVSVAIAEPISCEITQTSLETISIPSEDEEGNPTSYNSLALRELPLTVTVAGAGEFGTTMVVIERAAAYHVDRPDETDYNGFEGETVAVFTQVGESQITFNLQDFIGNMDDGAPYRLIATVSDSLGQTAEDELDFEVRWNHQATIPTVSVSIDTDNAIAILKPIAPAAEDDILEYESMSEFPVSGEDKKVYVANDTHKLYIWDGSSYTENTDVCDIYRLSVDKPELIYEGATFGEIYVDPYPTIGEYGGHRFVTRTVNGDCIVGESVDGSFAWTDTRQPDDDIFETHSNIIDFDGGQVYLLYEVDLSNSWDKNFKETQYLGGSVQGDWNAGYRRTGSLNVTTVSEMDQDTIQAMRRLATYAGACHVRTKDGSSYTADVQVKETYEYTKGPRLNKYDLSITRIDQEAYDGILYSEWLKTHGNEGESE